MKAILIGANGQLGTDICSVWPADGLVPLTIDDLDVTDRTRVFEVIEEHKPDLVLNTSAFHNVDVCELEPERAFAVNAIAVQHLADACVEHGAALLHMSTDYVFGGGAGRAYAETDAPDPVNVYGASKAAGEHIIRQRLDQHYIVRSSGLFGVAGAAGKGGNFVETMLRLAREGKPIKVVDDQVLSPTFTPDLAAKLLELVQTGLYGTYHITGRGACSWYDFARAIFEECGLNPDVSPTTTASFGANALRPPYSVLSNDALARAGITMMRPWREALRDYLSRKGHVAVPAGSGQGSGAVS
jgi:dTDP-4-dehydrorhamnose reductase